MTSRRKRRCGHDRLGYSFAPLHLVDQAAVSGEFGPGKLAAGGEIYPQLMHPGGKLLWRIFARQPLRAAGAGERVEDEGQLEAVAGAELAPNGGRTPVELVEPGPAAM